MSEIDSITDVLNDEVEKEDEIEAIDNLLNGETEEEIPEDEETQEEPAVEDTKETIDYNKEIPMPNGEAVTIGALKDAWQQQSNMVLEITERENAIIEHTKGLELMVEWLDAVPAEMKQEVIAYKQAELSKQHLKMLEAIPAWKDRTAFETGKQEIYNLAQEYGMTDLVATLTDHRAIKLLHDYAKLKSSLKAAQSTIKKAEKPAPINKPIPKKVKYTDEVDAVHALLKG